ncbi:MAG: hypothetical protein QOD67_79 [Caballeronia sp.]|nr:hypothetical protein [Caballeronia sp.]
MPEVRVFPPLIFVAGQRRSHEQVLDAGKAAQVRADFGEDRDHGCHGLCQVDAESAVECRVEEEKIPLSRPPLPRQRHQLRGSLVLK